MTLAMRAGFRGAFALAEIRAVEKGGTMLLTQRL